MMQAALKKFAFETVFAPDGQVLRDAAGTRNVYTREEVDAERTAAYEAGRADETVQRLAAIAEELATISTALASIGASYNADLTRLRDGAAELALAAARGIAGEALDAFGEVRVCAVVESVVAEALSAPRLVVKVGAAAAERLRPQIERIADDYGVTANLVVREDGALSPGDVSIDWGEGHVALSAGAAIAEIEARVRARLASEPASEGTRA
jgi:flagellar assembly protein FliH